MQRILLFAFLIILMATACGRFSSPGHSSSRNGDSTAVTIGLLGEGRALLSADDADSALVLLLDAVDYSRGCTDRYSRFELYGLVAAQYERKNLSERQQHFQRMMLSEAEALGSSSLQSEAHQRIAATYMVEGALDAAATEARLAYRLATPDTLDYRAETLLLLTQIYLQREQTDSAAYFLHEALRVYPPIANADLYRLSHVYVANAEGKAAEAQQLIGSYLEASDLYTRAELLRLKATLHGRAGQWSDVAAAQERLLRLNDSIAAEENAESAARIHRLQHERRVTQLEQQQRVRLSAQRTTFLVVVIIVLALLLLACIVALVLRRRVRIAHARELEALQLAEAAQAEEAQLREEHVQMQALYYENLYAIIRPILDARRGKTGHIDLEEKSWALIERHTDRVMPGFTAKLRQNNPSLSQEDVRFCCLIMMRVPNAILADVYGISSSSIAMRKQRMKKKFDDFVQEQTLENYLNQFGL